jgi:hypothetical protein
MRTLKYSLLCAPAPGLLKNFYFNLKVNSVHTQKNNFWQLYKNLFIFCNLRMALPKLKTQMQMRLRHTFYKFLNNFCEKLYHS